MTAPYWTLILVLAVAAFSIRAIGLFAGDKARASRHAWLLDELPGLIVVSLVASSLATQPFQTWIAAGIAVCVARISNNVIATMCVGVLIYAGLGFYGG